MDVQFHDLLTIGLLVVLEGLLSADNALVLAMLVLGLPRHEQQKALRYGIAGAFAFRIIAVLLAINLIQLTLVKLVGALYLIYLAYQHFFRGRGGGERHQVRPARPALGLSAFWATVVKVELTDLVFAVDSILVAVAMSPKTWVVITGGVLGIVAMRLVIGKLLALVRRYPALVDGAFVIVAWVGLKLLLEFMSAHGWIHFEVSKWWSFAVIAAIFVISYGYARRQGPADESTDDEATELLQGRGEAEDRVEGKS
jgi:YkoY family integral membrane protein